MKKIYGIILGVILASAIFFAFDKYMENEIQENKEEVRNHRTYERYWSREAQKLVMDENTLPIMGSSELMPLEDYNKNISPAYTFRKNYQRKTSIIITIKIQISRLRISVI